MNTPHYWNGKKKSAHIENIKPWTVNVEDKAVAILLDAFLALTQETIGRKDISAEDAERINDAAENIKETFLETARKCGIPVWFPTADSYDF